MIYKTNNTEKNIIPYKHFITLFSMLLFLILPGSAYANGMGALIYVPIILQLTIILSVFIAVLIKFILCKLLYSGDAKFSLKSFFLVMIVELIIMSVFTYAFLAYTSKDYDMRVTSFLSYLSTDIALLYFQKILVEHKYAWSLIGKSLLFVFVLSFINFIPNYKLLAKHGENRLNRDKHWLYTYLLSIIAPAFFCLIILSLVVAIQQREARDFKPEHKEAVDIKNELLRRAAATGYQRLVEAIISKGANVNASSKYDKRTALHEAVKIPGNTNTVRLLLQRGADVNFKSSYDFTPLMIACSYVKAESEIIQLLIDNGADINAQSFHGETALKIASGRNRGIWVEKYGVKDTIIEKMLLDYGADVNIKDKRSRTALMEASQSNNINLVKLLLDYGADVNIKDNEGKTAYMITSDPDVKQILVNHGAKIF